MASLANINIKFSADLKEFSTQMKNAERQLEKSGRSLQKAGQNLSLAVTAPFVALAGVSLVNFDKQAQAIAQVEQGLQSTGNAAGYTSEQLQKIATELQDNTLFGDEEILQNATAQLLTFTNIAGTQFERTQQAALDLATRLDGDLKSASIQLGKALNDPVANLSALSRSGIQFSKDQKAVINSLVETGRLAEAQTIILDELEKQYGGSAAAAAKAGTGPLKQLGNTISDLTEDFGALIFEAITPFIEKVRGIAEGLRGLDDSTKKIVLGIGAFAAALGPAILVLGTLIRNVSTLIPLIKALTVAIASNPIGAFAVAVTALAGGLLLANSRLTPLTNATEEFNNLTAKATQNIASEKAELEKYLSIAKNDKVSKEERQKAIKALNNLSPEYLGNLTLEKINTDEAKKATEAYTEALLKKAKIQAAEEKLVEVQKKLLDLQTGSNDAVKPSIWQNLSNTVKAAGNSSVFAAQSALTAANNFSTEQSELEKLEGQLLSFINTNQSVNDTLKDTTKTEITPTVNLDKAEVKGEVSLPTFGVSEEDIDTFYEDVDALEQRFIDFGQNTAEALADASAESFVNGVLDDFNTLDEGTDEAVSKYQEKLERLREIGSAVGSSVAGAFENMTSSLLGSLKLADSGFQGFIKGLVATITKLIAMMLAQSISQAIAGATASGTSTGPAAVFTTPAFIATAVGGVLSAFAAIPKFEYGGIVGGNSYYGDKILARVNSGELILNQRQQMAIANQLDAVDGSNIVLGGRWQVKGSDLVTVLDREYKKQGRRS